MIDFYASYIGAFWGMTGGIIFAARGEIVCPQGRVDTVGHKSSWTLVQGLNDLFFLLSTLTACQS